jgi:hypothetical protein
MTQPTTTSTPMTTTSTPAGLNPALDRPRPAYRTTSETKSAWKTTELIAYIATVVSIAVAAQTVGSDNGTDDYFRADKALLYITIATVGYLLSRGLAKGGSYEKETHDH